MVRLYFVIFIGFITLDTSTMMLYAFRFPLFQRKPF